MQTTTEALQFHLERLDAWMADLWAAKSMDLHMCDPQEPKRENYFGMLHNIRDDVMVLRREYRQLVRLFEERAARCIEADKQIADLADEVARLKKPRMPPVML